MGIQVALESPAAEGKADELEVALRRHLRDTRAHKRCQGVAVHQDQDAAPTKIVLLERWDIRADQEAHLAWRVGHGAMPELPRSSPGHRPAAISTTWTPDAVGRRARSTSR